MPSPNLPAHKPQGVRSAIEAAGAEFRFLPKVGSSTCST
jgi:hypothetical protein